MAGSRNGIVKMSQMPTDISFGFQNPNLLAVATHDRKISLLDVPTRKPTACMRLKGGSLGRLLCRKLEFAPDEKLIAGMSDDSLHIYDVDNNFKTVAKMECEYHATCIAVYDNNLIVIGEDGGSIVLFDVRTGKTCLQLEGKDGPWSITQILIDSESDTVFAVTEEGRLVTTKVRSGKVSESVELDSTLQCMGTFRGKTKLGVGDDNGSVNFFDWGQFESPSDKYKPCKGSMSKMIPITDKTAVVGYEDGYIRAYNFFPHQPLGVVGKHGTFVCGMDISSDGGVVATIGNDTAVMLWDLDYFESLTPSLAPMKKMSKVTVQTAKRNLPSSNEENRADFFSGL